MVTILKKPCVQRVPPSIGVMASMLILWAGGPRINTQSGTFNDNNYFIGLRYLYMLWWWMKLALSVVLFTVLCTCILPREMGEL